MMKGGEQGRSVNPVIYIILYYIILHVGDPSKIVGGCLHFVDACDDSKTLGEMSPEDGLRPLMLSSEALPRSICCLEPPDTLCKTLSTGQVRSDVLM